MTSVSRIVRGAAKALEKSERERVDEIENVADENREATISAIQGALRDRRRSRARRKWLVPIAAFAAVAAAALIVVKMNAPASTPTAAAPATPTAPTTPTIEAKSVDGSVTVEDSAGVAKTLAEGDRVHLGDRLVTGAGSATIVLPSGSRLDIEPSTTLRVDASSTDQRIDLSEGIVTQHVAKVAPGARYLVHAGDVEVEVRGTIFRVERHADPRCSFVTKVDVTEGRVLVRAPSGEKMLGAGEGWASPCVAAAAPSASIAEPAPRSPTVGPTAVAPTTTPRPAKTAAEPPPASDLAAQNALFGDAMAAKARGDGPGAIALLDGFLLKYPASPLHEAASAQRMRLLATSDRARAEVAAREYLARYPHGFARTEADRILTSSSF